jgi:hypothetical protein
LEEDAAVEETPGNPSGPVNAWKAELPNSFQYLRSLDNSSGTLGYMGARDEKMRSGYRSSYPPYPPYNREGFVSGRRLGQVPSASKSPGRFPILLLTSNPLPPYVKQGGFVSGRRLGQDPSASKSPGRFPILLLTSNPLPPYVKQGGFVSGLGKVWRRRDLNPRHCGYEPHALTD